MDWLSSAYPWIKSFHVISMVAWMAGLFYLPRIYVYHVERATPGSDTAQIFEVMEMKLLRFIMNPAMIATWVLGFLLIAINGWDWFAASPWLHAKIVLVLLLTWFHHWCAQRRKDFLRGENTRTGRHYRLMNEVPTLALIGIVILVIVQPF